MMGLRLNLTWKLLLISLVPFVVLGLTLQGINYYLVKTNFGKMTGQFEESLQRLNDQSANDLTSLSEQSAKELVYGIEIAIGNTLQTGETTVFLNFAQKQIAQGQFKRLSFYGSDGQLKLSPSPGTDPKTIPADILKQARTTKDLLVGGKAAGDSTLRFYQPLHMDADMVRMNPEYKVGDFFGVLFAEMELKKDRIQKSIEDQKQRMQEAIAQGQSIHDQVLSRSLLFSVSIGGVFLAAVMLLVIPLVTRGIVRPMRKAIQANRSIATYMFSAAQQFTSSSQTICKGAVEQVTGLQETSSSLEEITSMTRQNDQNAQQANTLAHQAQEAATEGAEAIRKMNAAIEDIRKNADSTSKIIKVIDEIAFQTNLLALNAAVEAARAGEAGKGFAVVAEEVRKLAIRSAEAAKNTESIIQTSVQQSQNGVQLSVGVSKTLTEILSRSEKTAALVGEIAQACTEQAQGIGQIHQSLSNMEKATQQNASFAEESASSAEELNSQAANLKMTVDEMVHLVENAGQEKTMADAHSAT